MKYLLLILLLSSCATYDKKVHCEEEQLSGEKCEQSWQEYLDYRRDFVDRPFMDARR